MTTTPAATAHDAAEPTECWCCATTYPVADLIRLGSHPEAGICLACAHYLHQQARARADARHPTPAARARDQLRSARQLVIRHDWHRAPIIGRPLRWLGRHLP
jgi:hypothetical protein